MTYARVPCHQDTICSIILRFPILMSSQQMPSLPNQCINKLLMSTDVYTCVHLSNSIQMLGRDAQWVQGLLGRSAGLGLTTTPELDTLRVGA